MRIIDKIFRDKKGNTVIYLLLTVGVILLAFGGSFSTKAPQKMAEEVFPQDKEQRLERVLSHIDGVGEAEVMISFEKEEDDDLLFSQKSGEGSGVKGVVIVADGGETAKVREKIIRATKAALGVETHKIEVFERKEKQ